MAKTMLCAMGLSLVAVRSMPAATVLATSRISALDEQENCTVVCNADADFRLRNEIKCPLLSGFVRNVPI